MLLMVFDLSQIYTQEMWLSSATKGIVTATAEPPRSYIVQNDVYRRNHHRRQLQILSQVFPYQHRLQLQPQLLPECHLTMLNLLWSALLVRPQQHHNITKPDRLIESSAYSLSTWGKIRSETRREGAVYSLFSGCLFAMFANCYLPLRLKTRYIKDYEKELSRKI